MKAIPCCSLKGGTGKSTICARLGLALRDKGYRIGFMDVDITGANLPSALGMAEPFPYVALDTANEKMLAVKHDGYEIFSLAFRFGKSAVLWTGADATESAFGQRFALPGTGRYQLVRQMLANVRFSELDFLLLDLPPNSGDETLSLWEHLRDLWGLVLVCQPTNLALQDIERTLNMIEVKQLPLLGMVGNMVVAIAPKSGEVFSPFLDAGVDLEGFCRRRGIPYLASIPFTPDPEIHRKVFQELADKVLVQEPVKIWQRSFKQRLQDATLKGLVKGIFSKDD